MAHSHTTLEQLNSQLAALLGDPGKVRFTSAEITAALRESIATLHAAALLHRARVQFSLVEGQAFYPLPSSVASGELDYETSDRTLINLLNYSIQEPQISAWGSGWAGSEQFTLEQITNALQRRRDEFLLQTGMVLTERNPYPSAPTTIEPGTLRLTLPDTLMDLRRAAWLSYDENGDLAAIRPLSREDAFTLQSFFSGTPSDLATPDCYSLVTEPQLTLGLYPAPTDGGRLHLLSCESGAALDPTSTETVLGVPEAFYWAPKYGVLADLFGPTSDSPDPVRARYCERRWRESIELARLYPSILYVEMNGRPLGICSLTDLDLFDSGWQNDSGTPNVAALPAWNMLALSPVPDDEPHSCVLDIVTNPILPVADGDYLQIDRAHLDVFLDFARHLLLFKEGGEEFLSSMPAYDRMVRLAAQQNSRLRAQATSFSALSSYVTADQERDPSGLRTRSRRRVSAEDEDAQQEEEEAYS